MKRRDGGGWGEGTTTTCSSTVYTVYVTVGRIKGSLVLLIFKPSAVVRASSQLVPVWVAAASASELCYTVITTLLSCTEWNERKLCVQCVRVRVEGGERGGGRRDPFFLCWCHQSVRAMADVSRLIKCWWDRSTDRPLRNTIRVFIVNYY